ncbi:hypothetical protein MUB24_06290 [Lederbergia sp. NSJ-179]|uniref:hypothetical protein n=1 Tax=Lederbergia sp. NSJ-179 TaxID=2931402 RepID=UPI001FD18BA0|nr:hypothetical protein [Lederbergia sp. NSJ-179]MCJ7840536.1 hypothetical protein [Lederbergia sp. NSJ-179]
MDINEKYQELGNWARCILEVHKDKPGLFTCEQIIKELMERYEKLQFEPFEIERYEKLQSEPIEEDV